MKDKINLSLINKSGLVTKPLQLAFEYFFFELFFYKTRK